MKRYYLFFILICSYLLSLGQMTTIPVFPAVNQEVKVIFDSKQERRLGSYTQDLYAHTGVGIEGDGNWQHVIGKWGQNDVQPKLTYMGDGVYELLITPDINTFYNVPSGEKVINISFVFRSADGKKQTNDLFVTVYQNGLNVDLQFPSENAILKMDTSYTFSAIANSTASLKLYLDGELIQEAAGDSIASDVQFNESGDHTLILTAENSEGISIADTVFFCVRANPVNEPLPQGAKKGITYIDDQSARLVLFAPGKSFVFVLGDFNSWRPMNSYQMKKNGDYFWCDLTGLESGKEYIFQYFIDGVLKIADPYSEKVSDPWNDSAIDSTTYPNLISYPTGKTEGIATVIQTGQQPYQWEDTTFKTPEGKSLVIYEMLMRDFTEEHTYQAVLEKLDYLSDLRINVLELMPINEFEGNNSWGYNPSFYFAPDKYYGPKNDLKKLVDECHKRGIAVVLDMVLNHSYGQSPMVQMYWDAANDRPAADNPWYNAVSPNTSYSWGYDFNHESVYTQELVDSVNSFWMGQYNVDGFRFDFTKGFTNKPGDGWAYDASRIAILERMADEIWKRKPGALVICEHLTDNTEEKELAAHGLMLWGNLNAKYGEAAMGYVQASNSDLSWGVYKQRGWTVPTLVTYAESHDEERLTYKCLTWGNTSGNYDTQQLPTALKRMELAAAFLIPVPGPKMIWQFGELGYDYSINTCDDGVTLSSDCRLSMKPIRWDYANDANRAELFHVVAALNFLKQNYEEFSSPDNFTYSLTGAQKSFVLSSGSNYVVGVGNFDLSEKTVTVSFPASGTWYDYFGQTTVQVNSGSLDITLQPGEYHLFSTRELQHPDIKTGTADEPLNSSVLTVIPNPVNSQLTLNGMYLIRAEIYNLNGEKIAVKAFGNDDSRQVIDVSHLNRGIYLLKGINRDKKDVIQKFIKQ